MPGSETRIVFFLYAEVASSIGVFLRAGSLGSRRGRLVVARDTLPGFRARRDSPGRVRRGSSTRSPDTPRGSQGAASYCRPLGLPVLRLLACLPSALCRVPRVARCTADRARGYPATVGGLGRGGIREGTRVRIRAASLAAAILSVPPENVQLRRRPTSLGRRRIHSLPLLSTRTHRRRRAMILLSWRRPSPASFEAIKREREAKRAQGIISPVPIRTSEKRALFDRRERAGGRRR